jgi:hypothetical protein
MLFRAYHPSRGAIPVRIGTPANKTFNLKLASLAAASARTIKTATNPGAATARFLLLLGDGLQSAAPRSDPGRAAGAPVAKARR